MKRKRLIEEVTDEYARLAKREDQQFFSQTSANLTPEKYYQEILDMVVEEISQGTFDNFSSGANVVKAVAEDKYKWLPNSEKYGR